MSVDGYLIDIHSLFTGSNIFLKIFRCIFCIFLIPVCPSISVVSASYTDWLAAILLCHSASTLPSLLF